MNTLQWELDRDLLPDIDMRPLSVALILALLTIAAPVRTSAQFVEPTPRPRVSDAQVSSGSSEPPINELLQQAAIDFSESDTRVRLKAAKIWAEPLDKKYFPIYILANPAALIPSQADSVQYTARELISQFGGLANVAIAKPFLLKGSVAGQVGPQGEWRAGAKYVQYPTPSAATLTGAVVGQAGGSFSWLVRLWNRPPDRALQDRPDTVSQRGLATLNVRAHANYLGSDRYRAMFRDDEGNEPPSLLGGFQADATLHLFDEAFLSLGYSFSSSSLVEGSGFAGVSLSRRRKPTGS